MKWRILLLLALASAPLLAEDIEERMRALEERNRSLEERVRELEGGAAERTPLPPPEPNERLLAEEADSYAKGEGIGLAMEKRNGIVRATLQLFGDVNAIYQSPDPGGRANTSFVFGGVNFFATAQVGDHVHILSETVVKTHEMPDQDEIEFDQERLYASWIFSDLLYLKFGLEHGPASRWNRIYHHGRWLETTVERPLLARFEGAGGILPLHNTGIEAGGRITAPFGIFEWVLLVANGRGPLASDPQKFSDRNDAKAIEGGFGFIPTGHEELRIGFDARWDEIPPDSADPARVRPITEILFSCSIEWRGDRIDIIAEYCHLVNEDQTSGSDFEHDAVYVQLSYRLRDRWTPYFRFDLRQMELGDPYFSPSGRDLDRWQLTFGVRFDVLENVAIKFEIGFGRQQSRLSGGAIDEVDYLRGGFQVSWVF